MYLTSFKWHIETPLRETKTISEILNDSELIPKGTVEKLFVLRKRNTGSASSSVSSSPSSHHATVIPTTSISETTDSTNRFVRFLKQDYHKDDTMAASPMSDGSSTGNVLKRLDQAIQSLENDKRQLDGFQYNVSLFIKQNSIR